MDSAGVGLGDGSADGAPQAVIRSARVSNNGIDFFILSPRYVFDDLHTVVFVEPEAD